MGMGGGSLITFTELTKNASIYHPNFEYIINATVLAIGGGLVVKGIRDYNRIIHDLYK